MCDAIKRNDGDCSWFEVFFDERELRLRRDSPSATAAIDNSRSRQNKSSRSTKSSLSKISKKINRRPSNSKKDKSTLGKTQRKTSLVFPKTKKHRDNSDSMNGNFSMNSSLYDDISGLNLEDSYCSTRSKHGYLSPSQRRSPKFRTKTDSLSHPRRLSQTSQTSWSSCPSTSKQPAASVKVKRHNSLVGVVRRISCNRRKEKDAVLWKADDETATTSCSTIDSNSATNLEASTDPALSKLLASPRNVSKTLPNRRFPKSVLSPNAYIGYKEQAMRQKQSEQRKSKIKSALYAVDSLSWPS